MKFGTTDEAIDLWRESIAHARRAQGGATSMSLLTDLMGIGQTVVLESIFDDLASYERGLVRLTRDTMWREGQDRLAGLIDATHREIFTIVPE